MALPPKRQRELPWCGARVTCHSAGPGPPLLCLLQLSKFAEGEEVSLESLEEKRIVNLSGRESRLPLKVRAAQGRVQPRQAACPPGSAKLGLWAANFSRR